MKTLLRNIQWLAIFLTSIACAAGDGIEEGPSYGALHVAEFDLASKTVLATLTIEQTDAVVSRFDFNAPADRYTAFVGDGSVQRQGPRVVWQPPATGGALRFVASVSNRRGDRYDAHFTERWALLRLDDVFPAAKVTTKRGARSRSSLQLKGPEGWSLLSRYPSSQLPAETQRRYIRPNGWAIAGHVGVRRETIAGREIIVAAPKNQGVRRLDMLTFLQFTLPALEARVPWLPETLLIVSARDEMWRGALSGPGSLYIHADRPLVSENGTSTLLHELVHVGGRHRGDDWLVEGLAEYFGVLVLRESGGLSEDRFDKVLADLLDWATRDQGRLTSQSSGADTACAVVVLAALDTELPGGVAAWLGLQSGELSGEGLRTYAERRGVPFPQCR